MWYNGAYEYLRQPWNLLDMASISLVTACITLHLQCNDEATPSLIRTLAGVQASAFLLARECSKPGASSKELG